MAKIRIKALEPRELEFIEVSVYKSLRPYPETGYRPKWAVKLHAYLLKKRRENAKKEERNLNII